MAEQCSSCGAELFAGQQFCRACGTPTRQISGEELPTQMLPHQQGQQPTVAPPPLATSPLGAGRHTSEPVYGAGFHTSQTHAPQPQQPTAPIMGAPPYARRRSRGWLYAVLALVVVFAGASVVAGLLIANHTRQRVVRATRASMPQHPAVPHPPAPPRGVHVEAEDWVVEDEGAEVSGRETTITKTYPLTPEGVFELRNINGNITVEGWDEQRAEVKIIKRGGSPEEREALRIVREETPGRLAFNTASGAQGGVREVEYQIKLPRNLRELGIVSNNSNVELTNLRTASISINLQRGNIDLADVSGTVNSRTTKGNTHVVLTETGGEARPRAPQVFNGVNGNIELELAPDTNAELKAETVEGDIEVDEELGVKVEKRMVGQQAVGRLGRGGEAIVVKTVSGNIKIKS